MSTDFPDSTGTTHPALVNVTIPVFNEEAQLAANVTKLIRFLAESVPHTCEIVIANNASTDGTREIAWDLARQHAHVHVLHLNEKGRGRAVKRAWLESRAEVLSFMDVDLSTDLSAFPALLESITSDQFDVATGSRLLQPELTKRGWKREWISRGYNHLIKTVFHTHFSDAQCGFKAIRRDAARHLLPLIENTSWFFDTELLVLAEKLGYRIFDLPVRWVDDSDSRVEIIPTAIEDLRAIHRLREIFDKDGTNRAA